MSRIQNFKKIIVLSSLFLAAQFFYSCKGNNNSLVEPEKNSETFAQNSLVKTDDYNLDTDDLYKIAKGLVYTLKKQSSRDILYSEVLNSKYCEHILEASEFLNKKEKIGILNIHF